MVAAPEPVPEFDPGGVPDRGGRPDPALFPRDPYAPPWPAPAPPGDLSPPDPATAAVPWPSLRLLGPNWYAAVMGTAIVASAGIALPIAFTGLTGICVAFWLLSFLMLLALLFARTLHWRHHPDEARAHLVDPTMAPFYGCLPMALLAVGGATLIVGNRVVGDTAALYIDVVLWIVGTVLAILVAAAIPYLMVVRHELAADSASPIWLLPVVAPMVAAALGAALVPHLPHGQWQSTMILGCYALFGMSLLMTLTILPGIWNRLVRFGALPLALTPTLFLILGPLGQSVTAVGHIAEFGAPVVRAPYGDAMDGFALLYGVPVLGFACCGC